MSLDILVSAAFIAGFVGSGHCFGMCGPVVVLLESPANRSPGGQPLARRLLYNAGRLLFYALLGAIAGASGLVLTKLAGANTTLGILRVVAALLVVALGLNLLFNLRSLALLEKGGTAIWQRVAPLAKHVLPMTTPIRALGAGFVWGALPCGLVYSAVAIAATSGEMLAGITVMAAFWLGTLPALLFAGASAKRIADWAGRPFFRRIAGTLLVLIGLISLALPYLPRGSEQSRHEHANAQDLWVSQLSNVQDLWLSQISWMSRNPESWVSQTL